MNALPEGPFLPETQVVVADIGAEEPRIAWASSVEPSDYTCYDASKIYRLKSSLGIGMLEGLDLATGATVSERPIGW